MHREVERRVASFVDDLRASPAGGDVLAVVVSGSAAREEERWVDGGLESDIDVMVVSRSSPLRLDRAAAVERVFAAHADASVEGGRIPVATLDYATLANFEARQRGVVVDGDAALLSRIPISEPSDIPTWEAVRLLANRLFEHLKHRGGMASGHSATIKSYEAIGESQLVLERRYRPSFMERVAEMSRRPLDCGVPDAQELYAAAVDQRRGGAARIDATPERALEDLGCQLGHALTQLGLEAETVSGQLQILSRREFHLKQRVYWTLRGAGRRDGRHLPTVDPILQLWRAAVAGLSRQMTEHDSRSLVQLWQQCPQILRKGARPSS